MNKLVRVFIISILLALGATPALAQGESTLKTRHDPTLGTFLTDDKGMTLYVFDKDTKDKSACNDSCAENWPPLKAEGSLMLPQDVPGTLTEITRNDGTKQVAYNGRPLYYYAADQEPGDTNGEGVGNVWHVARVAEPGATPGASPAASPEATPGN